MNSNLTWDQTHFVCEEAVLLDYRMSVVQLKCLPAVFQITLAVGVTVNPSEKSWTGMEDFLPSLLAFIEWFVGSCYVSVRLIEWLLFKGCLNFQATICTGLSVHKPLKF